MNPEKENHEKDFKSQPSYSNHPPRAPKNYYESMACNRWWELNVNPLVDKMNSVSFPATPSSSSSCNLNPLIDNMNSVSISTIPSSSSSPPPPTHPEEPAAAYAKPRTKYRNKPPKKSVREALRKSFLEKSRNFPAKGKLVFLCAECGTLQIILQDAFKGYKIWDGKTVAFVPRTKSKKVEGSCFCGKSWKYDSVPF